LQQKPFRLELGSCNKNLSDVNLDLATSSDLNMHMDSFGSCNNGFRPDLATVQTSKTLWISNSNLLLHGTNLLQLQKIFREYERSEYLCNQEGIIYAKACIASSEIAREEEREAPLWRILRELFFFFFLGASS
jgi:hypothetical protein